MLFFSLIHCSIYNLHNMTMKCSEKKIILNCFRSRERSKVYACTSRIRSGKSRSTQVSIYLSIVKCMHVQLGLDQIREVKIYPGIYLSIYSKVYACTSRIRSGKSRSTQVSIYDVSQKTPL
jgi:hypothetical protein